MKVSHIGVIAVMLLVIAIAIAGCTSPQTSTTPAGGSGKASSAAGAGAPGSGAASGSPISGSASAAGSSVSGSGLFGGLSYNWVEYKMSGGSAGQQMTVYIRYDKSGKCSMRFEGAPQGMPATMDCSAKGGTTAQSDPNQVSSDAQVSCSPVDEQVTVPAGTFSATKCTVTAKGSSSTVWVAKGKFLVKMEAASSQGGSGEMELNAYG